MTLPAVEDSVVVTLTGSGVVSVWFTSIDVTIPVTVGPVLGGTEAVSTVVSVPEDVGRLVVGLGVCALIYI